MSDEYRTPEVILVDLRKARKEEEIKRGVWLDTLEANNKAKREWDACNERVKDLLRELTEAAGKEKVE